jgi:hypothetical protein
MPDPTTNNPGHRDDPRVRPCGDGFRVDTGPGYEIRPNPVLGWGIFTGPNQDLVQAEGGGFALGYQNADQAIDALLGVDGGGAQ